jgi:hypothetical protein
MMRSFPVLASLASLARRIQDQLHRSRGRGCNFQSTRQAPQRLQQPLPPRSLSPSRTLQVGQVQHALAGAEHLALRIVVTHVPQDATRMVQIAKTILALRYVN